MFELPVTGNPSEIAPYAQKRVEITLNNDIISRAAIKQINCHAHRAKISNYPVSPPHQLSARKPVGGCLFPVVQSFWLVLQD